MAAAALAAASLVAPLDEAAPICQVQYTIRSEYLAFESTIVITNISGGDIDGWTLYFVLPADQLFSSGWDATWSGSKELTAVAATYNAKVPDGASPTPPPKFRGTGIDTTSEPTEFTVNGHECKVV